MRTFYDNGFLHQLQNCVKCYTMYFFYSDHVEDISLNRIGSLRYCCPSWWCYFASSTLQSTLIFQYVLLIGGLNNTPIDFNDLWF